MSAPFINVTSYLALVPIGFGFVFAIWRCMRVIAGYYGVDLDGAVPWMHLQQGTGLPAPVFMIIMALFVFAWGLKIGPQRFWFRIGAVALLVAIFSTPYWLSLPIAAVWAISACLCVMLIWRRLAQPPA